ncbi:MULTISPECIES: helix-turn-helix domain-containing protein [unclassified Streptomyces]|uniref:helix-turn-helix domain-containing protein n=1 Tax=unclassified Streptomyces TaxID=2593676 RepID=UPI0035D86D99
MSNTLTIEQIHAAQGGDEVAMMEVIDAHAGLIESFIQVATSGKAQETEKDDLRQEARIVILTSLVDYRTDSAATLTTFVYQRLEAAVRTGWVALRPGLTAGTSTEQRVRRAFAEADGDVEQAWLEVNAGRERGKGWMTRETFDAALQAMQAMKSFDQPAAGGTKHDNKPSQLTLADVTADPYASSMTNQVEARMMVEQAFRAVKPRHEFVMRADYGIDVPKMESAEIADHLGIGPSRVRGLRADALASARRALRA